MARPGKTVCVVIADGDIDIIQESGADLNMLVRWLKGQGQVVKVKHFPNWEAANEYEDKHNA